METRIFSRVINQEQDSIMDGSIEVHSLRSIERSHGGVDTTANILLIDTSGSTREPTSATDDTPKLARAKEVMTMTLSRLPASSYFSLISFDDPAKVEISLQPLRERLTAIKAVQRLAYSESTGMRGALTLALRELRKVPVGYFSRIFCVSDGMGSDGSCIEIADKLKALAQVQFIGLGSGEEIDEDTMRQLASVSKTGKGTFYMHFTEFSEMGRYMRSQTQVISD